MNHDVESLTVLLDRPEEEQPPGLHRHVAVVEGWQRAAAEAGRRRERHLPREPVPERRIRAVVGEVGDLRQITDHRSHKVGLGGRLSQRTSGQRCCSGVTGHPLVEFAPSTKRTQLPSPSSSSGTRGGS